MNRKSVHEKLIAGIESEAVSVFGDAGRASSWLTRKNLVLGDSPLSMLHSELGASQLRRMLASIASGGVV